MRKTVALLLYTVFTVPLMAEADTYHHYFNGRVAAVSESSIQLGKRRFSIASGSRIVIQKKLNGAYLEEHAKISMINQGDSVTVRAEGTTVNEIIIERWKR
jgi:hypothetical protein